MLARTPADNEIFAGNRAVGSVAVSVAAEDGVSRRQRVHEAGSLRVRFPNTAGAGALEAVIVNTAGGMTGGDRFNIEMSVGAGAGLSVTTAAAEKVYRSLGPDTQLDIKLKVGAGGALLWVPQETIVFDQVSLRRGIEADLAPDATLILAEGVVFGRSAMGEAVQQGRIFDRWRMRVGGTLAFAETLRLEGAVSEHLSQRAVAGGGVATATVLKIPGGDGDTAAVRAIEGGFAGEVGISAWNGQVLARLVASDGAALHHDLVGVLTALSTLPLPRLWLN